METNQNTNDEMQIDLGGIFREIWSKAPIIIFAAIAAVLLSVLVSKTMTTPTYTSSTRIYVLARNDSDTLTSADLQAGAQLTTDYAEIIRSRQVTETVIAELGLQDGNGGMMRHETLLGKISVTAPEDSRVITISVQDADPYTACDIADTVRDVAAEHIQNVMEIQTLSVVENANIPLSPNNTSARRNGVMGGLAGAVLSIVIVVAIYLLNDTIRTGEDVERYLELSVLGSIPLAAGEKKASRRRNGGSRKKGR